MNTAMEGSPLFLCACAQAVNGVNSYVKAIRSNLCFISGECLQVLSVVDEFIKRRDEFIKNLIEERNIKAYFFSSTLVVLVFSAVYGSTMGIYADGLQIVYSAIKIPILLLLSLYLTVPSYYVLSSLFGGKRTLGQTVTLLLSSFTIMSTVLVAFVPVNLFFILTTEKSFTTYAFTVLMNITIFALSGFFALFYFVKGANTLYQKSSENWKPAFLIGSVILAFVGTQLAWVLRPYFNYYPDFIRPLESNFYTEVTELMVRIGLLHGGALLFMAIFIFLGIIFLVWLFSRALRT